MGLIASKFAQKPLDQNQEDETGSIPSTPILTPKGKLNCEEIRENGVLDPRSPSRHISRTPIELVSLATKQQSPTLHITTNGATIMETPLKTHLVLGFDPRSPSTELNRTPIIVDNASNLPQKLKNKNLDKVRNGEMRSFTPKNEKLSDSVTVQVTPKNKRQDLNKRKSLVLLETNIDYTETNLDDVIREKYSVAQLENFDTNISKPHSPTIEFTQTSVSITKSTENIETIEQINQRSNTPVEQFVDCLEQAEAAKECEIIISVIESDVDNNEKCELLGKDEAEIEQTASEKPETEFKNTESIESIVDNIMEALPEIQLEAAVLKVVEIIEPAEDEPELINEAIIPSAHSLKSMSEPILSINLTADVKELDKKLTNLIYEDDDLVVCPKVVKPAAKIGQTRTPLGQRQCGSENSKSTKLRVSDKPRKSQIPLFKEKRVKVQCENTPPRSMRQGGKGKKPQWDVKNDTLVI